MKNNLTQGIMTRLSGNQKNNQTTQFKTALVGKVFGTVYLIHALPNLHQQFQARIRGNLRLSSAQENLLSQRHLLTVGDEICFEPIVPPENPKVKSAVITKIQPRRNQITRSLTNQKHDLAANVDCAFILTSLETMTIGKRPKLNFLDRVLIAISSQGIEPVLVFSKVDTLDTQQKNDAKKLLAPYFSRYPDCHLVNLLNTKATQALANSVDSERCVLIGQSGSGKSTFINQIFDGKQIQKIHPVNAKTKRGLHTTSNPSLFVREFLANRSKTKARQIWIDSPGIREWGLDHLTPDQIISHSPEFGYFAKVSCLTRNCLHLPSDPNCRIQKTLIELKKRISHSDSIRERNLLQILETLNSPNKKEEYAHRRDQREVNKNHLPGHGNAHFKRKNLRKGKMKQYRSKKNMWM